MTRNSRKTTSDTKLLRAALAEHKWGPVELGQLVRLLSMVEPSAGSGSRCAYDLLRRCGPELFSKVEVCTFLDGLNGGDPRGDLNIGTPFNFKPKHLVRFLQAMCGGDRGLLSCKIAEVVGGGFVQLSDGSDGMRALINVLDRTWTLHETVDFASRICSSTFERKRETALFLRSMVQHICSSETEVQLLVQYTFAIHMQV